MLRVNRRDVRGTVSFDIYHNAYEDLLEMIFPFFYTFLVPGHTEKYFRFSYENSILL